MILKPNYKKPYCAKFYNERGITLAELLLSMVMFSALLAAASSQFLDSTRHAYDNELINRAEEQARIVLDLMAYDLRLAGAGMPLGQDNFEAGGIGLGDSPLPLLTSATSSFVEIRVSEQGRQALLLIDYTPDPSNLTISVSSTDDFVRGDIIYLSDMVAGGTNGMRAEIVSVGSNSITIDANYFAPAGVTFESGTTVTRVTTVSFSSDSTKSSIIRDDGDLTQELALNASFTLEFLDGAGTAIALPMSDLDITSDLAGVNITIMVDSERALKNGSTYVAEAKQSIAFRNINMNR